MRWGSPRKYEGDRAIRMSRRQTPRGRVGRQVVVVAEEGRFALQDLADCGRVFLEQLVELVAGLVGALLGHRRQRAAVWVAALVAGATTGAAVARCAQTGAGAAERQRTTSSAGGSSTGRGAKSGMRVVMPSI